MPDVAVSPTSVLAATNAVPQADTDTVFAAAKAAGDDSYAAVTNVKAAHAYSVASKIMDALDDPSADQALIRSWWNNQPSELHSMVYSAGWTPRPGFKGYGQAMDSAPKPNPPHSGGGFFSHIFGDVEHAATDVGHAIGGAASNIAHALNMGNVNPQVRAVNQANTQEALKQVLRPATDVIHEGDHLLHKVPGATHVLGDLGKWSNWGSGQIERGVRAINYTASGGIPGGADMMTSNNPGLLRYLVDPDQWVRAYDAVGNGDVVRPDVAKYVKSQLDPFAYQLALEVANGQSQYKIMAQLNKGGAAYDTNYNGTQQTFTREQYQFMELMKSDKFQEMVKALQAGRLGEGDLIGGEVSFSATNGRITGFTPSAVSQALQVSGNMFEGWETSPIIIASQARSEGIINKYSIMNANDYYALAANDKNVQRLIKNVSDALKAGMEGNGDLARGVARLLSVDPRRWTAMADIMLTPNARAILGDGSYENVLHFLAGDAGRAAIEEGRAGNLYKDATLWPSQTRVQNLAQKAKINLEDVIKGSLDRLNNVASDPFKDDSEARAALGRRNMRTFWAAYNYDIAASKAPEIGKLWSPGAFEDIAHQVIDSDRFEPNEISRAYGLTLPEMQDLEELLETYGVIDRDPQNFVHIAMNSKADFAPAMEIYQRDYEELQQVFRDYEPTVNGIPLSKIPEDFGVPDEFESPGEQLHEFAYAQWIRDHGDSKLFGLSADAIKSYEGRLNVDHSPSQIMSVLDGEKADIGAGLDSPAMQKVARLVTRLTTLMPESQLIDLSNENAEKSLVSFQRFSRYFLDRAASDILVADYLKAGNIGERRRMWSGLVSEMMEHAGLGETQAGRDFMEKWNKETQRFASDGGVGHGYDTIHFSTKYAIPSFRDLYRLSKKSKFMESLDNTVNSDYLSKAMDMVWKPAMLLRPGFAIRFSMEEVLNAVTREGIKSYLEGLSTSRLGEAVTREVERDPLRLFHLDESSEEAFYNVRAFEAVSGRMTLAERVAFRRMVDMYGAEKYAKESAAIEKISGLTRESQELVHNILDNKLAIWTRAIGAAAFNARNTVAAKERFAIFLALRSDPSLTGAVADEISNLSHSTYDTARELDNPDDLLKVPDDLQGQEVILSPVGEMPKPTRDRMLLGDDVTGRRQHWAVGLNYAWSGVFKGAIGKRVLAMVARGWDHDAMVQGVRDILDNPANESWVRNADYNLIGHTSGFHVGDFGYTVGDAHREWAAHAVTEIEKLLKTDDGEEIKLPFIVKRVADPEAEGRMVWQWARSKTDQPISKLLQQASQHGGIMPNFRDISEMEDKYWDQLPDRILGRDYVPVEHGFAEWYRKVLDKGFHEAVGKPSHAISRQPLFIKKVAVFYPDAARIVAARVEAARIGLDLGDIKGIEYEKFDISTLSPEARQMAMDIAKEKAYRAITPFVHNPQLRSQFSSIYRNVFPFWFAQEQQMKRWARAFYLNPALIREGELTLGALRGFGWIYTDPDTGQGMFMYPGSQWVMRTAETMLNHLGAHDIPLPGGFSAETQNLLPGLNAPGVPSFGPIVSVPLDTFQIWAPAFLPLNTKIQGSIGANESPVEQLLPTVLSRAFEAWAPSFMRNQVMPGYAGPGQANSLEMNNAFMEAVMLLTAQGKGLRPDMTDAQLTAFNLEVQHTAQILMTTRVIFGLFAPASPSINLDNMKLDQDLISLMDSGMPYNEAIAVYLTEHPNGVPYTVGTTTAPSGAEVPETEAAAAWLEHFNGIFGSGPLQNKDYNLAIPWLLPTNISSGGAFSDNAFQYQLMVGVRNRVTTSQWESTLAYRMQSTYYYAMENSAYAEANAAGSGYQEILNAWGAWKTKFLNANPQFANYINQDQGATQRKNTINSMIALLNDKVLPDSPTVEDMKVLMNGYSTWYDWMASNPEAISSERWSVTQQFKTWAAAYAEKHPDVYAFYNGVIAFQISDQVGKL